MYVKKKKNVQRESHSVKKYAKKLAYFEIK